MKTLVLGMGNTILRDDGIGIKVVREAAERPRQENVDFSEASVGGLRILDVIAGYQRVVMVDAIQTRSGQPGDIYRLTLRDLKLSLQAGSSQDVSLPEVQRTNGRCVAPNLQAGSSHDVSLPEVQRTNGRCVAPSLHAGSSHDVSLPVAIALGRAMGWTLPDDEDFVIIAIEVEDPFTFGEECTSAVEEALPRAVDAVLAEVKRGTDDASR